jgi:hypothetical protein
VDGGTPGGSGTADQRQLPSAGLARIAVLDRGEQLGDGLAVAVAGGAARLLREAQRLGIGLDGGQGRADRRGDAAIEQPATHAARPIVPMLRRQPA